MNCLKATELAGIFYSINGKLTLGITGIIHGKERLGTQEASSALGSEAVFMPRLTSERLPGSMESMSASSRRTWPLAAVFNYFLLKSQYIWSRYPFEMLPSVLDVSGVSHS